MCPARAPRPASPRCTSCRRTRRRSGRARRRSRPISAVGRASGGLSGRLGDRLARGDRPRLRARSRPHRLRRRLRRSAQSAGARLPRGWRRGDPHHARLSGLSDRHARRRRDAGGGAGEELHRRRRRDPQAGDAAGPRSCSSPIRTIRPAPICRSTRSSACTAACRRTCCWCIDAAYAEYVRRNDYEAGIELVATSENVVMTRTFSKIHGLAALRLGWMYGPAHVVDAINRIRGPFNVNSAGDRGRHRGDRGHRASGSGARAQRASGSPGSLTRSASSGSKVTPSVANFVLIHFPTTRAAPPRTPMRS